MSDTTFASGYPFIGVLLTMLALFAWIVYIWIAITIVIDILRRTDMSGLGKVGWILVIVILSWLGVLIYLIVNHQGMQERRLEQMNRSKGELDDYIRQVTASGGPAAEIDKAKRLLDSGAINQTEFDAIKRRTLGTT